MEYHEVDLVYVESEVMGDTFSWNCPQCVYVHIYGYATLDITIITTTIILIIIIITNIPQVLLRARLLY